MFAGLDVCINTAAPTSQHLYTYMACIFFLAIDCKLGGGGNEEEEEEERMKPLIKALLLVVCVCKPSHKEVGKN